MTKLTHDCDKHLTLISYKWDNTNNVIIYKYMCKCCNCIFEEVKSLEDFSKMFNASESYNKFSL